jgi:hypothetical protein
MKFDGFSFAGRINRAKYWRIKVGLFFANFFFHIWVATQFSHTALHRPPTKTGGVDTAGRRHPRDPGHLGGFNHHRCEALP